MRVISLRTIAATAALLATGTFVVLPLRAQDKVQVDELLPDEAAGKAVPKGLGLRVRLVVAEKAPAKIAVGFRRGLYWKRAGDLGTVAKGEWTPTTPATSSPRPRSRCSTRARRTTCGAASATRTTSRT